MGTEDEEYDRPMSGGLPVNYKTVWNGLDTACVAYRYGSLVTRQGGYTWRDFEGIGEIEQSTLSGVDIKREDVLL